MAESIVKQEGYVRRVVASLGAMEVGPGPHLWRLLAEGMEPVTVERFAARSRLTTGEIETWLKKHPGIDYDEKGRIMGFGVTLRPTPHKFTFERGTLFGWCASDVLLFPFLLDKPGIAESTCPATGVRIRVELTPTGVTRVDPPGAVVSEVRPTEKVHDLRAEVCGLGMFFSSREAAAPWLKKNPQGFLNSVADDFDVHRQAFMELGWAQEYHGKTPKT